MHKITRFALLFLMLCNLGFGQDTKNAPKLLGYIGPNDDDVLNGIFKLSKVLEATFIPSSDTFAVRVCSNDPLPVALATAKGDPFLTTLKLEKLGIPKSRMYYLRQSKNCLVSSNDYALTEYWLIPINAELPEFVEARKVSSFSGYELTHADFLLQGERSEIRSPQIERITPQSYIAVIDNVVKLLNDCKSAVVVVQVPYYKYSPTTELTKNVGQAQTYLRSRGIADHRIYIKRINAGTRIPSPKDTPLYPDITVVSEN